MLKLTYLPANQAFAFTFGDALIRLYPKVEGGYGDNASHPGYGAPMPYFYADKYAAVQAAEACGLTVNASGEVRSA